MRNGFMLVPVLLLLSGIGRFRLSAEPLTVEQVVDRSLSAAQDLEHERALLLAKEMSFSLGLREYLPQLSVAYGDSTTVNLNSSDTRGKTLSFSVTQPVFRGGIRLLERKAAGIDLRLTREEFEQKLSDRKAEAKQAFFTIKAAEAKRDILARTIEIAKSNMEIIKAEVRLGSALEVDAAEANLEEVSLEIQLAETEASIEDNIYQIKKLLGLEPEAALSLIGELDPSYGGLDLAGKEATLFSLASAYSPDLKRQELTIGKADIALKASRRAYLPNVDLEVSSIFSGREFPLGDQQYSGKLTFSFSAPEAPTKYSGGASSQPGKSRGGNLSVEASPVASVTAWLDRRTALLSLRAEARKKEMIVQDLRYQVQRMANAYSQSRRSADLARKKLEVQKQKVAILEKELKLGEVKRIDLLKGEIELANARIALSEAVLQLIQGEGGWEKLLGLQAGGLARLAAPNGDRK